MDYLVGRRKELEALRCLEERTTAVITGPAGIGKSSLLNAALRERDHCIGSGLPSLEWSPYFALQMAVGERLDGHPEHVAAQVARFVEDRTLAIDDLHWVHPATIEVLDALHRRLTIVVTARGDELSTQGAALAGLASLRVDLGPLADADATRVVRNAWPGLDVDQIDRAVAIAGGVPLLLELLPSRTAAVAPTVAAALRHRLGRLPPGTVDGLLKLALLGRPSCPDVCGLDSTVSDLLVADGDLVWFVHPHIAEVLGELASARAEALHRELAAKVAPADAAAHHLAAGDAASAYTAATAAAAVATTVSERAHQLHAAVLAADELGDAAVELRIDAARQLVDAYRAEDAIAVIGPVTARPGAHRPEALLLEARARWFSGDVPGARTALAAAAAAIGEARTGLAARIHVERSHVEVRAGMGDVALARRAVAVAEAAGEETLRARALLGAALLYAQDPAWEPTLRTVLDEAHIAGEAEIEFLAAWHLTSGLGFTARLRSSNDLNEVQAARAIELGVDSWRAHFESAWLVNETLLGSAQDEVVGRASAFLRERKSFRNLAQVRFALALASGDLARLDRMHDTVDELMRSAVDQEERTWAAAAGGELAWLRSDGASMSRWLDLARLQGEAYFGLRIALEAAAAHLAMEGILRDFEPDLPHSTLPVMWPALHDLAAFERWRDGDVHGAAEALAQAADDWTRHEIPRFAARARAAQSHMLKQAGIRGSRAAHHDAVEIARAHDLVGHLRRWATPTVDCLSGREAEVLAYVARGLSSREIGSTLGLSVDTVDSYILTARRKLGARSRTDAALLADRGDE